MCKENACMSTLNIVVSVTYYLESHNAVFIYCVSHILPTNVKLVDSGHYRALTTLLDKITSIIK